MKIIRDTREQQGFQFFAQAEIIEQALDAGDYTIEGLEDFIRIERKASTGELYHNLAKKTMKARFHREMEKLDTIHNAYIVCEFPESFLYTFPENSGIPKSKRKYMKIGAKYFRKLIHEIEDKYDVEFIYCDSKDHAEEVTFKLLKEAWDAC
tara:strand:- start:655 stop:1110 length:456 start_codon:yes stop_codon:yes gene_type:complete